MLRAILTAATLAGVGWLAYRQETLMAKFDEYDAAWNEHKDAIAAAVARVQEDVDALLRQVSENANDQAAVDERAAALRESTAALNNIDPVKPAEPEQPTA